MEIIKAAESALFVRFAYLLSFLFIAFTARNISADGSMLQPSTEVAVIDGDVFLGGLFPVHAKGIGSTFCGELNEQVGIHRVEAMLYAIDQVNNNKNLLPNITLGTEIRDDCGTVNTALEQCLNFVLGALANREQMCPFSRGLPEINNKSLLGGVVGPSYSTTTVQVASLLRLFDVPQVSYAATSSELSDKDRFEYFVRTVPPDSFQAQAMVDIVRYMNWTAVFAVYSRGSYGEQGMLSFKNFSEQSNVCIADSRLLEPDYTVDDYDRIIERFLKESDVRVVVMFCNYEDLRSMLLATKRSQKRGKHFIWLASDFWGTRLRHLEGLEDIADGAITLEVQTFNTQLKPFYDYFLKLNPSNNTRNPWFSEYWEKHFNCTLRNTRRSTHLCKDSLHLSSTDVRVDAKVPFVIDAVFSLAHALHNLHKNVCGGLPGFCPQMKNLDRTALLRYLQNVSFNGTTGLVRFNNNGDSAGKYDIYDFSRAALSRPYQKLGSWIEGDLKFNARGFMKGISYPESHCGKPCGLRGIKHIRDALCCYTCENCDERSYVVNEFTCKTCDKGMKPNATFNGCEPLRKQHLSRVWIVIVMTVSSIGIIATLIVCGVFIKFAETPLIKASGHEMSFVLIVGLLLCYGLAFVLVAYPSNVICAIQRLGLGLAFSVCYASLLVRTNRIARIFSGSVSPSFISPKSQLLITAVIIAPELTMAVIALFINPPKPVASYEQDDFVLMKCNISTIGVAILCGYNALLVLLCTFYAFRTRKTPLNFNEAKFIGFCMYTSCVIWIASLPVYFGVGGGLQVIALAFSSVISATTILLFIFLPKVYIVLFKPEKNIRSNSRLRSRTKSLDFNIVQSNSAAVNNGGTVGD